MKVAKVIIITLLIWVCINPSQLYWDKKVKEYCGKDGGVTVYEHVELSSDEYIRNDGKHGFIQVWPEEMSPIHHEYAWRNVDTIIHQGNPEVWREEYTTYRKSDGKKLGKWVTYTRRGGDLIPLDNASSYSCKNISGFENNPTGKIFSVKPK